jgi:hypothetical protein
MRTADRQATCRNQQGSQKLFRPNAVQVFYNGHIGDHMKISTVREFRDKATGMLRSKDPILVTRRGRLAGVFFPLQKDSLPGELTSEIARQIKRRGISEKEVLADFEGWRKARREARRGR